jgi:tRNA pseudouridine32 synthase / 23S rRNA pseudouridine746 synthase
MNEASSSSAPDRGDGARVSGLAHPVAAGDIQILHEGRGYVVIEKPAWMLSVPGKGVTKSDCAAARVGGMFPRATGPLVVHRLDMETSGLMVFALSESAQRDLSHQFEERVVQKQYVALVSQVTGGREGAGRPLDESGEISLPLRADIENRPVQIVDFEHGREAVTRWCVLGREIDRVRVLFEPRTGRTHQLRVHAARALEHPIVGDGLYGGEPADRLMLHASRLSFLGPGTRRRVEFRSDPPF